MATNTYVPGVCNIGPAERQRRRQAGIVGCVATIVLLGILVVVNAPHTWRLLVFVPATLGAVGFLQDAFHFCVAFGMAGIYNVVNSVGTTDDVVEAEFRRQDRKKALTILGLGVLIGAGVAALGFVL